MPRTTDALLILLGLLFLFPSLLLAQDSDPDQDESVLGGPFRLELRAGYTGTMWTPKGLEPYEVNNYGRKLLYAELAVLHPLLVVGEALDIVRIPRLRVETNFGYTASGGGVQDMSPRALRNNAYLRSTGWLTVWQWFSFRYREEIFDVTIADPRDWILDQETIQPGFELSRKVRNRMTDLEIGLIGSPDGEIRNTMIEVGYYHSSLSWPMVLQYSDPEWGNYEILKQQEFTLEGVYFALNTQPIPRVWPMQTQFMLRTGGALGLDARFRYEHQMLSRWFLGLELDASYRIISNYKDENDEEYIIKNNNPRDVRYRMTLYTVFVLL